MQMHIIVYLQSYLLLYLPVHKRECLSYIQDLSALFGYTGIPLNTLGSPVRLKDGNKPWGECKHLKGSLFGGILRSTVTKIATITSSVSELPHHLTFTFCVKMIAAFDLVLYIRKHSRTYLSKTGLTQSKASFIHSKPAVKCFLLFLSSFK